MILKKSSLKLISSKCSRQHICYVWSTCVPQTIGIPMVPTVLPLTTTGSFVRTRQTSCRSFSRKTNRS